MTYKNGKPNVQNGGGIEAGITALVAIAISDSTND
jgi:hypothetical protein